jgi:hypothetical protein
MVPTVTHGRASVMVWAAISLYSVRPIITHHGRNTAREYVDMLGYFRTTMQFSNKTLPPIHTAGTVYLWFEEQEDELKHLPWTT